MDMRMLGFASNEVGLLNLKEDEVSRSLSDSDVELSGWLMPSYVTP